MFYRPTSRDGLGTRANNALVHGRYTSELGASDRKCPRYALLRELSTGAFSEKTARHVEASSGA